MYPVYRLFGHIHNVIEPAPLTNGIGSPISSPKTKESKSTKLKSPISKNQPDIVVLSDSEEQTEMKTAKECKSPKQSSSKSSSWPDAKCYQYEVKLKYSKNMSGTVPEMVTVKQSQIR